MADPAPLQPDLPFDLEAPAPSARREPAGPDVPVSPADAAPSRPAWRPAVVEPPPPPLTEQLLARLRGLPWSRWRAMSARVMSRSGSVGRVGARYFRVAGAAAAAGLGRGAPYAATLAKNIARAGLVRAALRLGATALHIAGLPGVVIRTAVQFSVVHRAGLSVETATYFEVGDPAGYVVYEAPKDLSTGLAVAFVPTVILVILAVLCLAPALAPRTILHLHPNPLTWLQLWVGLALAAHALPNHGEAAPLAEQARAGVAKAQPLALIAVVPAQLTAWLTWFGGLAPALVGIAATLWLSGLVFR